MERERDDPSDDGQCGEPASNASENPPSSDDGQCGEPASNA